LRYSSRKGKERAARSGSRKKETEKFANIVGALRTYEKQHQVVGKKEGKNVTEQKENEGQG